MAISEPSSHTVDATVARSDLQFDQSDSRIGWYGKLPAAGDFLMRRLPDEFRNPWDQWLSAGMTQGKAVCGDQWESDFLCFPVWRFFWHAAAGQRPLWAGLLMPGVDRVGRLFPLTVAMPLVITPEPPAESLPIPIAAHHRTLSAQPLTVDGLDAYLDQLQRLALQVLEDDDIAGFDAALRALPAYAPSLQSTPGAELARWFESGGLSAFLAGPPMTLFWCRDVLVREPMRIESCPPSASCFVQLVTTIAPPAGPSL